MDRRRVLAAGAVLGAAALAGGPTAWAAPARQSTAPRLSAGDVAAARRLFAAGDYTRLRQTLPPLLAAPGQGSGGAGRAARVWVLASQLAVKLGDTTAGEHAARAHLAARAAGEPLLLAAAARAAATPLRRTGRTHQALDLLLDARAQLAAGRRRAPEELEAAGMITLTASYTAAHARRTAQAVDLADEADDLAARLARTPGEWELTAGQCALYRIGIHRRLGDVDTALTHARRLRPHHLPTPERRARAHTDTARALIDAGEPAAALTQLYLVHLAAPDEARRPSVRALADHLADHHPALAAAHHPRAAQ
jgi:hypothetical protein